MSIPRCEICGNFLSCETDTFQMVKGPDGKMHQGYGKMAYIHTGPCVPRPIRMVEETTVDGMTWTKQCKDCETEIEVGPNAKQTQRCEPCRHAREKKRSRDHYRARQQREGYPPVRKSKFSERFPNYTQA